MLILLFIFLPFVAFLRSCCDLRSHSAQLVFVLFFALFGYCHTFSDTRADSFRKFQLFSNYQAENASDILSEFMDGERRDIYESLLLSLIKQFTDNPHIMMMIVGLIGGVFCMLIVRRFLEDKRMGFTWAIAILLGFVVIECGIVQMGGIRNFTAYPLVVYSIIRLLIDGRKIWLIGILAAPLIHFGYIIITAAVLVIWLIRIPNGVMHYAAIAICLGSLFLSTESYTGAIDIVTDSIDNDAISSRVSNYGEESVEVEFNKSLTTRLVRINNQLGALFVVALLVYLRRQRRVLLSDDYTAKIYHIVLFFVVVSYAIISFSVVGQRFVYVAMMLLYMLLLNIYQNHRGSGIRGFIYAMPVVFGIHILWTLYNCYCNTGLDIYFMPLPVLFM